MMLRYLPILKGKEGEFEALRNLSILQRQGTVPLVDLIPRGEKDFAGADAHFDRVVKLMVQSWGIDYPIFLDTARLDSRYEWVADKHHLTYLYERFRHRGVKVNPVLGFDRPQHYIEIVTLLCKGRLGRNLCIRIGKDDLLFPEEFTNKLSSLMKQTGVEPTRITILLDFEYVDSSAMSEAEPLALESIRNLIGMASWEAIVFAASSFPGTTQGMDKDSVTTLPRVEFRSWENIAAQIFSESGHNLSFGDYTVVDINYSDEIDYSIMNPAAKIRCSTDGSWIVFKGKALKGRTKVPGKIQYPLLASRVVDHSCFRGAHSSWGDSVTEECATKRKIWASLSKWVAIDVNRHITFVGNRVANHLASLPSREYSEAALLSA